MRISALLFAAILLLCPAAQAQAAEQSPLEVPPPAVARKSRSRHPLRLRPRVGRPCRCCTASGVRSTPGCAFRGVHAPAGGSIRGVRSTAGCASAESAPPPTALPAESAPPR